MGSLAVQHWPNWPAAMTRDVALAYTGVADAQMKAWMKDGKVSFRSRGPNGAMLALRSDLDAALVEMFTSTQAEDFEFGK
jgi:hypothetical protein